MIMETAQQKVFNSTDLRKYILKFVLKDTYLKHLSSWVKETLQEKIKDNWYLYCNCNGCRKVAYERLNGF